MMKTMAVLAAGIVAATMMTAAADVTVENGTTSISFDDRGRVSSIKNLRSGRELLEKRCYVPLVCRCGLGNPRNVSTMANVVSFEPSAKGTKIRFEFRAFNPHCVITVDVQPCDGYFMFDVVPTALPEAWRDDSFTLCGLDGVVCRKYVGRNHASMLSDDDDAIMMRPIGVDVDVRTGDHWLGAWTKVAFLLGRPADRKFDGRVALVVNEKSKMIPVLKKLTVDMGIPHTNCGGAWALDSEDSRLSYLHAYPTAMSMDSWIDMARRIGFGTIHLEGWWEHCGSYEPAKRLFPGGMKDMKECYRKIKEAGLIGSFHTLSVGVDVHDKLISCGKYIGDLQSNVEYTLKSALPADGGSEVLINEEPVNYHDTVLTYHSRGNVLRIGDELIQYRQVLRGGRKGFAQITRGALGTRVSAHPAGEKVAYLRQNFMEFFPRKGSALAKRNAERIAAIEREIGAGSIYLDGSDGLGDIDDICELSRDVVSRLLPNTQIEMSVGMSGTWWWMTRMGTWDNCAWGPKRFHDLHIEANRDARKAELLQPQMGWWAPRDNSDACRGHFPDEIEYVACKNLGIDGPFSVQFASVTDRPLTPLVERQLTVLGRWERLRLARYFDDATVAKCAVPGDEYHLVADKDGEWRIRPLTVDHVRALADQGSNRISAKLPGRGNGPVDLRIVVQDNAAPYDDDYREEISLAEELEEFDQPKLGKGVELSTSVVNYDDEDYGAIRFKAVNKGEATRGAYAGITRRFKGGRDIEYTAFGCWVKGDGSGTVLDLQLVAQREYAGAPSDHIVKVDWTGWKYLTFFLRERDVEERQRYEWPFHHWSGAMFRRGMDTKHVGEFTICLNELPVGKPVEIEVSDVYALPERQVQWDSAALIVNGGRIELPFTLANREMVEVGGGFVRKYGTAGDLVAEMPLAKDAPKFSASGNEVALEFRSAKGVIEPRTDIYAYNYGEAVGARGKDVNWSRLRFDFDDPAGFADPCPEGRTMKTIVRKEHSEKGAALNFEVIGPMKGIKLEVGGVANAFPDVGVEERLVVADGKYILRKGNGAVVRTEALARPFPRLQGGENEFKVYNTAVTAPKSTTGRISWYKDYE